MAYGDLGRQASEEGPEGRGSAALGAPKASSVRRRGGF